MFGDDDRRVVRQHHAAGTDADMLGPGRNVADGHRRRGRGDAGHVVMFGHPETGVAPLLGVGGEIACIVERAARIGRFSDANQIEN